MTSRGDDGRTCQMQVCRYHKPGNCGLDENNWLNEMLKDDTRCIGSPVSVEEVSIITNKSMRKEKNVGVIVIALISIFHEGRFSRALSL
ncbi:LOW QUALITY PROTEIN: hypothetical protein ACHAWC_010908 [Mediolabrus comicus]